ncbi:MAG TPA: hypothetical protein VIG99_29495 [Myxococcaceae bacterium]|jgi:hypothetical protein
MVSLSRTNPFSTLQQTAAPFQAAATTRAQAPAQAQALTMAGNPAPAAGAPAAAGSQDVVAQLLRILQSALELFARLLSGQDNPDNMEQAPVITPDAARAGQPAMGGGAPRAGGGGGGGHWGVVHTCKSGWITDEVKGLTKYGYNPLRQGVGTPYDQAVSMWERDNGRKFSGLQR